MHAPESVNYNIYASGGWNMHGCLFANTKNWLGKFFCRSNLNSLQLAS